jgi:uncharacterized membrane protein YeaQ/YmgE (transglycosylase-associated protein family)
MAEAVCQYRKTMPQAMHEALDELAEALELAHHSARDRHSERSHLANITMAHDGIAETIPPSALRSVDSRGIGSYGCPMFKWPARFPTRMSLSPRLRFLGKAAIGGVFGGGVAVVIGALTILKGLGPLSYILLAVPGAVLGVMLYLIAREWNRIRGSATARGAPEERCTITFFVIDRWEEILAASRWVARCFPIQSLFQRHGLLGRTMMMGVFGAVVAMVIGALTGTEKLIGPLSYVFLAALGGALVMVLYLIAHEVTASRSATKAHGTEDEER